MFWDVLQALVDQDPGLTGNLLVERLVGANVQLISKEEYAQLGSVVGHCFFSTNCCYYYLFFFLQWLSSKL